MRILWNFVYSRNLKNLAKNRLFIFLCIVYTALFGALIWLLVGRFFLPGFIWLVCFMGYPAMLWGLFGGSLYLATHGF